MSGEIRTIIFQSAYSKRYQIHKKTRYHEWVPAEIHMTDPPRLHILEVSDTDHLCLQYSPLSMEVLGGEKELENMEERLKYLENKLRKVTKSNIHFKVLEGKYEKGIVWRDNGWEFSRTDKTVIHRCKNPNKSQTGKIKNPALDIV